jgi:uncharacterized cupin superfamily protein
MGVPLILRENAVYSANVRCLHIGNKNFVDICLYVDYTMLVQRK